MRKIMDLPENTTMRELEWWASVFRHPIALKLRKNLELWIDDGHKNAEVEKIKALYHGLASDALPVDSLHWDEYEGTMRQLEIELRALGVDL